MKTQTIRKRAFRICPLQDPIFYEAGRKSCAASPGEKCWVWLTYQTKEDYRSLRKQILALVKRSFFNERGKISNAWHSLFWNGNFVCSFDSFAEAGVEIAQRVYDIESQYLVPSEILAEFEVTYQEDWLEDVAGVSWLDRWNFPVSGFGPRPYSASRGAVTSKEDTVGDCPKTTKKPEQRIIRIGLFSSHLEPADAVTGLTDESMAEVQAYFANPSPSPKKKRRVPHFLRGVLGDEEEEEVRFRPHSRRETSGILEACGIYNYSKIKKFNLNPTPLGNRIPGRRFRECPRDWEDPSDWNFRHMMSWRLKRPDERIDKFEDEDCFFEL